MQPHGGGRPGLRLLGGHLRVSEVGFQVTLLRCSFRSHRRGPGTQERQVLLQAPGWVRGPVVCGVRGGVGEQRW